MTALIAGFSLGFSLILAIGAQNAFVLKQGLKKQHVFLVSLLCAVSDAILIGLGVSGFAVIVSEFPLIEKIARYGGATFLIIYALKSFNSAYKNTHAMQAAAGVVESVWKVALTCLALTWLNPHVYLDTVFLLGSISTQYSEHKGQFAVGASLASFIFFFSLGYGARLLQPLFEKAQLMEGVRECYWNSDVADCVKVIVGLTYPLK